MMVKISVELTPDECELVKLALNDENIFTEIWRSELDEILRVIEEAEIEPEEAGA